MNLQSHESHQPRSGWYPSDLTILPIEAMIMKPYREPGSMILFEDDEHLRFWVEHTYRKPDDDAPRATGTDDAAPKFKLVPFDEIRFDPLTER